MRRLSLTQKRFVQFVGVLGLSLAMLAGCGKREKITPPDDLSTVERVNRGWQEFSSGNFDAAVADFSRAAADSAGFVDAHVGEGWSRLSRATDAQEVSRSIDAFNRAANLATSLDAVAGRAAARLAQGGTSLNTAAADADEVLAGASNYSFSRRTSFTAADLRLIKAFAKAAQAEYAAALTAADQVQASGIQAGNPSTWTIDGVTYSSFPGAVLAQLAKLSNQFAG